MEGLTIGQLAGKAGVHVETVRYYERRGLVAQPKSASVYGVSDYRRYPSETVRVIRFIKRSQRLGFSLKEIKELLRLHVEDGTTCGHVKEAAQQKLDDIETKIEELQSMSKVLKELIKACLENRSVSGCPLLESLKEDGPSLIAIKKEASF